MHTRWWILFIGAWLLIGLTSVLAQTYVHGEVDGTWNASGNPYIVEHSITVTAGKTLTINPGVEVYCSGYDSISIYGGLYVLGNVMDSVIFAPLSTNIWNGIFFMPGALDNSEIAYARIWGASVGVTISGADAGIHNSTIVGESRSLTLFYAAGTFADNTISCTFLTPTAVYMLKSDAKLLRNTITSSNTDIELSGYAIYALYCSYAVIDYNYIQSQGVGEVYGILCDNCDYIQLKHNLVESVSTRISSGISGVDSYQPFLLNNTVVTASASVDKGISCFNTHAIITNCIVTGDGNSIGIYCLNSNPTITYNNVWYHGTNYQGCTPGEGSISLNPLFVGGIPYSYHLNPESPCIDVGNPNYSDPDGTRSDMGAFYYPHVAVSSNRQTNLPLHHQLEANYPNPFNSETIIPFAVSQRAQVTLEIFNVLGQRISVLMNRVLDAGEYRVSWSAGSLPSGIYFCKMEAGEETFRQKIVLLK
jgi:hypothetical protein